MLTGTLARTREQVVASGGRRAGRRLKGTHGDGGRRAEKCREGRAKGGAAAGRAKAGVVEGIMRGAQGWTG